MFKLMHVNVFIYFIFHKYVKYVLYNHAYVLFFLSLQLSRLIHVVTINFEKEIILLLSGELIVLN